MRALIQRVANAQVSVEGKTVSAIGPGFLVLLGVGRGDGEKEAAYLARKTANLRVFRDEEGKLNRSLLDIDGEALVVSQFTLYADTSRGNRPGFEPAAPPELAEQLYELYVRLLREAGVKVYTGVFQAEMLVELANDGPVTILLESKQEGAAK